MSYLWYILPSVCALYIIALLFMLGFWWLAATAALVYGLTFRYSEALVCVGVCVDLYYGQLLVQPVATALCVSIFLFSLWAQPRVVLYHES